MIRIEVDAFNRAPASGPDSPFTSSVPDSSYESSLKARAETESDPGLSKFYRPQWLQPISPETRKLPR